MLGLALMGSRASENWTEQSTRVDFFDMKGEVEQLLACSGGSVGFERAEQPGLHDGQTARVMLDGSDVGVLGTIHPQAAAKLDLPPHTVLAELELEAVLSGRVPAFEDISRFPETRRDIAVVVGTDVPAAALTQAVAEVAGPDLADLRLFDVYTGEGVAVDKKSVALGLTFRNNSRTLDDEETSVIITQVVDYLKEKYEAELRA